MKQIERIQAMEKLYDELRNELLSFEHALNQFQQTQDKIKELSDYYTSPLWLEDVDDDTKGKFPTDLKRGVLSQDAIFLLLEEIDELIDALHKLNTPK